MFFRLSLLVVFIISVYSCTNLKLSEAQRQYGAKNYEKSLNLVLDYLKTNPADAETWFFLGRIYGKINYFNKMNNAFEHSLQINTKYFRNIKQIKNHYFSLSYEKAVENYRLYKNYPQKDIPVAKNHLENAKRNLIFALIIRKDDKKALQLKENMFADNIIIDDLEELKTSELLSKNPAIDRKFILENNYLAVLDLQGINIPSNTTLALTNRLYYELFSSKIFVLLERQKMKEILKEQAFQLSGCTSTECMIEAGKLLNVNYMLGGTVSKMGSLYSIDVRLIDVESGKIFSVAKVDLSGDLSDVMKIGLNQVVRNLISEL